MKLLRIRPVTLVALLGLVSINCDNNSIDTGSDGGAMSGNTTRVRLANLVPGGPPVDFCYRTGVSGAFNGPALHSVPMGLQGGLQYPQVSEYVTINGVPNAIRLVAAGSVSCEQDLAGTSALDILGSNITSDNLTVAATGIPGGTNDAQVRLGVYPDTRRLPASGSLLRFVHAAAGVPPVDVGTVVEGAFSPLVTGVEYGGRSSAGGMADENGFLTLQGAPLTTTLVVRAKDSGTNLLTFRNVMIPGSSILSVFAIGTANGTGIQAPSALLCNDLAQPVDHLTPCTRLTM